MAPTSLTVFCIIFLTMAGGVLSQPGPHPLNRTLIVTSILEEPYMMMRNSHQPLVGNDRYEGFIADLLIKVMHICRLDYVIKPVTDGSYGSKRHNGTWNGMVGELIRKEADMSAAPLTVTSLRERVVDFSYPFMHSGITGIMKRPRREPITRSPFFMFFPFSWSIWLLMLVAFLVVWLLLWLYSRLLPGTDGKMKQTESPCKRTVGGMLDGCWMAYKSFLLQGVDGDPWPGSLAARVLVATWMSFLLLSFSLYTVGLVHALRVAGRNIGQSIKSVEDLTKQTEIQYGTIEAGSTKSFFRTSQFAVYERMWSFMDSQVPTAFVMSSKEGIERVKQGDYVFFTQSTTVEYIVHRDCELMQLGGLLDSRGFGFAFPLNSPYKEIVNLAIIDLHDNGDLEKLYKKWWHQTLCVGDVSVEEETECQYRPYGTNLRLFTGPSIILAVGVVSSLLLAAIQVAIAKLKPSRPEPDIQQLEEDTPPTDV